MFKHKKVFKTNGEMGKCKTKAIRVDLGICRHFLVYPGIFKHSQTYSAIPRNYSGIV